MTNINGINSMQRQMIDPSQYYGNTYANQVMSSDPDFIGLTPINSVGGNGIFGNGLMGGMMPGMGAKMGDIESMVDEKQLARTEAIVLSMTPKERQNPKLLNPSRKYRIAKGAGVDIAVVNRFIKQFEQSQKMMKQMPGMMGGMGKKGKFKFPF